MLDNTLKRQGKAQKSGSCSFFPLLHALRRLYSGTLCQQHTRTVASTAQNHDGTQTLKLSRPFIYLSGISDAPEDLTAAVSRTQGYLENDNLRILVPDRGEDCQRPNSFFLGPHSGLGGQGTDYCVRSHLGPGG